MPAKPVFTEEQYETLRIAARRVWKTRFEAEGLPQQKMALALGISQQSVSHLLRGTYRPGFRVATEIATLDGKELHDLVGDFASSSAAVQHAPASPTSQFGNLEVCVQFHAGSKQWSAWTLAAARAGFFGPSDFAAPDWTAKLDGLERALESARKKM